MAPTPKDTIKDFEQAFERVLERRNRIYSEKVSEEDIKESTRLLRDIKKWNEDAKAQRDSFSRLYSQSQAKQKADDDKREKDRLAANNVGWGNLRAFLYKETDGIRKSLKEGFGLNILSTGKMGVQLTNAFGLFGKFDVSGLIKKFDDYKAFSKERTEKNREQKMIESMYTLFVKEGKSKDQIRAMMQLQGVKDDKIREMMSVMTELYRERLGRIQVEGVNRGLGNRGRLIANMEPGMVGTKSDYADLGGGKESAGFGGKRSGRNKPGTINFGEEGGIGGGGGFDNAILKDTYTELLKQGRTLDSMLLAAETYNTMYSEFTKEQQEEWERSRGAKGADGKKGGLFNIEERMAGVFDNAIGGALGNMVNLLPKLLGNAFKLISWVGIGLAIGEGIVMLLKSKWFNDAAKGAGEWVFGKERTEFNKKQEEEIRNNKDLKRELELKNKAADFNLPMAERQKASAEYEAAKKKADAFREQQRLEREEFNKTHSWFSLGGRLDKEDEVKAAERERNKKSVEKEKKRAVPGPSEVSSPSEATPVSQQNQTNTFMVGQRGMAGRIPGALSVG